MNYSLKSNLSQLWLITFNESFPAVVELWNFKMPYSMLIITSLRASEERDAKWSFKFIIFYASFVEGYRDNVATFVVNSTYVLCLMNISDWHSIVALI